MSPTKSKPSSTPSSQIPDPFARNSIKAAHFLSNQPPLHASKFLSFFSDAAARDAEAHGHPHVPEPTYLTLIPEVCLPFSKIRDIVRGQVANLEPVVEERARLWVGDGEGVKGVRKGDAGEDGGENGEGEEVTICRIRGAIKGWYNVFQDILTDEGDIYYLKRVMVTYKGKVLEAYRPTEHFPGPKNWRRKRESAEGTTPRSRSVVEGRKGRLVGRFLHWRRKEHDTPRSKSVS